MLRHISELHPGKIDSLSNGEYALVLVSTIMHWAQAVAAARIEDNARRTGRTRCMERLASFCTPLSCRICCRWRPIWKISCKRSHLARIDINESRHLRVHDSDSFKSCIKDWPRCLVSKADQSASIAGQPKRVLVSAARYPPLASKIRDRLAKRIVTLAVRNEDNTRYDLPETNMFGLAIWLDQLARAKFDTRDGEQGISSLTSLSQQRH